MEMVHRHWAARMFALTILTLTLFPTNTWSRYPCSDSDYPNIVNGVWPPEDLFYNVDFVQGQAYGNGQYMVEGYPYQDFHHLFSEGGGCIDMMTTLNIPPPNMGVAKNLVGNDTVFYITMPDNIQVTNITIIEGSVLPFTEPLSLDVYAGIGDIFSELPDPLYINMTTGTYLFPVGDIRFGYDTIYFIKRNKGINCVKIIVEVQAIQCLPCGTTYPASYCESCSDPAYTTVLESATPCDRCAPGFAPSGPQCTPCLPPLYKPILGNGTCGRCGSFATPGVPDMPNTCVCLSGYEYNFKTKSCVACKSGYFKRSNANLACSPCDLGQYQSNSASTGCLDCPIGTYTSTKGTSQCTRCPANSTTNQGSTSFQVMGKGAKSFEECICNAGYFGESALDCQPCPVDTYKTLSGNNMTCTSCPFNTTTNNATAATNIANCQCRPGQYQSGSLAQRICLNCPKNTYTASTNALSCLSCPNNSITLVAGSSTCLCAPGYYYKKADNKCILCPANTFKADFTSAGSCEPCATGSTTNGTTGSISCGFCDSGYKGTAPFCEKIENSGTGNGNSSNANSGQIYAIIGGVGAGVVGVVGATSIYYRRKRMKQKETEKIQKQLQQSQGLPPTMFQMMPQFGNSSLPILSPLYMGSASSIHGSGSGSITALPPTTITIQDPTRTFSVGTTTLYTHGLTFNSPTYQVKTGAISGTSGAVRTVIPNSTSVSYNSATQSSVYSSNPSSRTGGGGGSNTRSIPSTRAVGSNNSTRSNPNLTRTATVIPSGVSSTNSTRSNPNLSTGRIATAMSNNKQ